MCGVAQSADGCATTRPSSSVVGDKASDGFGASLPDSAVLMGGMGLAWMVLTGQKICEVRLIRRCDRRSGASGLQHICGDESASDSGSVPGADGHASRRRGGSRRFASSRGAGDGDCAHVAGTIICCGRRHRLEGALPDWGMSCRCRPIRGSVNDSGWRGRSSVASCWRSPVAG